MLFLECVDIGCQSLVTSRCRRSRQMTESHHRLWNSGRHFQMAVSSTALIQLNNNKSTIVSNSDKLDLDMLALLFESLGSHISDIVVSGSVRKRGGGLWV